MTNLDSCRDIRARRWRKSSAWPLADALDDRGTRRLGLAAGLVDVKICAVRRVVDRAKP